MARLKGIEEVPLVRGQRMIVGGIVCDLLWPPPAMEGVDNDASLVARLTMGGVRVLVTGDLEAPGEAALLASGLLLRAEVLQLPHHGSRTSSSPAFLQAVQPVIALAATGVRPRFAYPDPAVARRTLEVPAVLVVQGSGVVVVGWNAEGRLTVGTAEPVLVARRRGPRAE
jgi:competence protein ComEC